MIKIYTIGFTKISASSFFSLLKSAGVRKLIDVRLNNVSQLSGFAKKDDLKFFLEKILNAKYEHCLDMAPTQEMFDSYKKNKGSWEIYAGRFNQLIKERRIEKLLRPEDMDGCCLLCSEEKPHYCHRRLVAEYLKDQWQDVDIQHLTVR